MSTGPAFAGQPSNVIGVVEVCGNETSCAAGVFDIADRLGAAFGTSPVHHHLGTARRQFQCHLESDS